MATAPPRQQGSCVLIVDDDADERESLRDVVEMLGLSAQMAANAEEALAMLVHSHPCLVILDVLMPGMTGVQMLEKMRQDPRLSQLPVVMSTSAPERVPRGVAVLPKPVNIDALCGWMKRSCRCEP
jgi:CheY-like chemotaxis protein